MKKYTVENPGFHESIMIVETTDPAHADNVNASPKALIENDLYLKKMVEEGAGFAAVFDAGTIIAAFKKVYGLEVGADPTAMTPVQVMAALATEWDGEASPDPSAMTPGQVAEALATEWDGGTSPDPSAMTAEQVAGAIK